RLASMAKGSPVSVSAHCSAPTAGHNTARYPATAGIRRRWLGPIKHCFAASPLFKRSSKSASTHPKV
ncbi:hypothetical protein J3B02_005575, partial [Coemansia erecta]